MPATPHDSSATDTSNNRRADDRLPVKWAATLTTEDDAAYAASVHDVSYAGMLVRANCHLREGESLLISIEGLGEFACKVRWVGSEDLGLMVLGGDDLMLKKFAEHAGAAVSDHPVAV